MGGSVDIQSRYWGSSYFQETYLSFSKLINTIYTMEIGERVPIGTYSNNANSYVNFKGYKPIIKPGGYTELEKNGDLGSDDFCCTHDWRYAWVDTNNQMSQNANLFSSLYTCDPRTIQVGTNNICDDSLYKVCINENEFDLKIKSKCYVWLKGLYTRYLTSASIISDINNKLRITCSENIDHPLCDIWLSSIRNSGNPIYFDIADSVLRAQKDKSRFKCSFPPQYIIDAQRKIATPRECWYKECVFSPNHFLLTENITLKNNCMLTECNINIGSLDIVAQTEIVLTCNNTKKVNSSKSESESLHKEAEDYRFLIPDNTIFFLLILIFLLFLILKNN